MDQSCLLGRQIIISCCRLATVYKVIFHHLNQSDPHLENSPSFVISLNIQKLQSVERVRNVSCAFSSLFVL